MAAMTLVPLPPTPPMATGPEAMPVLDTVAPLPVQKRFSRLKMPLVCL